MIVDRSIVTRLNPEPFRWQYLSRNNALFAEDEWAWSDSMAEAHVFEAHREADIFAKGIVYKPEDSECMPPFARVLQGGPEPRQNAWHSGQSAPVSAPVPEEVYSATARRLGERE